MDLSRHFFPRVADLTMQDTQGGGCDVWQKKKKKKKDMQEPTCCEWGVRCLTEEEEGQARTYLLCSGGVQVLQSWSQFLPYFFTTA